MIDYQLSEQRDQQRLAEWQHDPELLSLEREISAMRLMMEQVLQRGQVNQAIAIAVVIGKLTSQYEASAARKNNWVSKRVLQEQVAPALLTIISQEVSAVLPPDVWSDVAARLELRFGGAIARAENETKEDIKLITGK